VKNGEKSLYIAIPEIISTAGKRKKFLKQA
jgi:hypothetical protein